MPGAGSVTSNSFSSNKNIGGIVGSAGDYTTITYCRWRDDIGANNINGGGNLGGSTGSASSQINPQLTNFLNNRAPDYGANKWVLNHENKSAIFKVNFNNGFLYESQAILLQDLVAYSPLMFSGWYTDIYCTILFQSPNVTEDITLYGLMELSSL